MNLLIAKGEGKIIKIREKLQAHYLPVTITGNPNYPLKLKEKNIVELYENYIIIRPKIQGEI